MHVVTQRRKEKATTAATVGKKILLNWKKKQHLISTNSHVCIQSVYYLLFCHLNGITGELHEPNILRGQEWDNNGMRWQKVCKICSFSIDYTIDETKLKWKKKPFVLSAVPNSIRISRCVCVWVFLFLSLCLSSSLVSQAIVPFIFVC